MAATLVERTFAQRMVLLRWVLWVGRAGRGRRQGLEIGDDRVDLAGIEGIFEARHAWRAVGDEVVQRAFVAAERALRKDRAVLPGCQERLGVTHAAVLVEELHALERFGAHGRRAGRRLRLHRSGCEAGRA